MANENAVVMRSAGILAQTAADADPLATVQRLGSILAASGYFSDVRDMAQAAVKVMAGQELGIAPVAAVMGIHIIKGKVTLSANLIAAQVRRHGYNFRHIRFDTTGCILEFINKDGAVLGESSFTEQDAKTAGVFGDMYKKYPRNMYFSRAMSNGAKWYCPEVTCGLPVYVPEELGARVNEDGELEHEPEIDTGGHPMNTAEARDYVRDKKLAEIERQKRDNPQTTNGGSSARNQVATEAASGETDARQSAGTTREIPPSSTLGPDDVPAPIADLWKRMGTKIPTICAVFGELKKAVEEVTGAEQPYYDVLARYDMKHANDVKTAGLQKARNAARELAESIAKWSQPPFEATDDDLPEALQPKQANLIETEVSYSHD